MHRVQISYYVNNLRSISIENNNIVIIINYINSMKTEQFTDKSSSLLLD